jgi:hypothetical protein
VNTKLRLGPLPSTDTLKLTITVPVGLKAQLDRYAALHSETWGETVLAADLIPHMLTQFILRDKAFKAAMRRERSRGARPQALDQP